MSRCLLHLASRGHTEDFHSWYFQARQTTLNPACASWVCPGYRTGKIEMRTRPRYRSFVLFWFLLIFSRACPYNPRRRIAAARKWRQDAGWAGDRPDRGAL